MAAVRRHWALVMALPLLVLSVLFVVLQRGLDAKKAHADAAVNSAQSTAQASPTTRPATPMDSLRRYRHIQGLRSELALTTQDLAALGVSSTTAQQIFVAVKAFAISSVDALAAADSNCQTARHALQDAVRSINAGTGDETTLASLPTLQQNVTAAASARSAVLAPLVSQVGTLLTSDQQVMWQAAQVSAAIQRTPGARPAPGAYRYVSGLTSDQIQQLYVAAYQNGASNSSTTSTPTLSQTQLQQAQLSVSNQQTAMAGVASAEVSVLPVPQQMMAHSHTTTRPAPAQATISQ